MLHRLLLTRDPPAVQLQVTAVVQETIRAAQDHLQRQRTSKGQELTTSYKHVFIYIILEFNRKLAVLFISCFIFIVKSLAV